MFYTLEITLQNRKPKNQRTIEISDNQTFQELTSIICDLFGFNGEHLWEYRKEDKLTINHPLYELPSQSASLLFGDIGVLGQSDLTSSIHTANTMQEVMFDPEFDDLQGVATQVSANSYYLSDYFTNNTKIEFIYDFGENWKFDIEFKKVTEGASAQQSIKAKEQKIQVAIISGTGCYLMDDSGGPIGLREYLDQYVRQQRDSDGRENYEEFSERIQPATRQFDIKKHP